MADVTDRGQLILILGLLVAVTFVVLALLLNTVIFTENLASRGTDAGGRDAIEYRNTIADGVGGLVGEVNEGDHASNESARTNVSDGLTEIDRLTTLRHASRGVAANVSNVTLHNGSVIRQTDPARQLTSAGGGGDWILATDVSDTRRFAVTLTGGLNSTTDPDDDSFKVWIQESAGVDTWLLAVYDNQSTAEVEIAVQNASGGWTKDICDPPTNPPVTINLSAGTVGGEDCSAIDFAKGISGPYDVQYDEGDLAEGTYNLTVNVSGTGSVETFSLNGPGPASSPYFARAVYSASFDVRYETPDLTYRAQVRVAPGEST